MLELIHYYDPKMQPLRSITECCSREVVDILSEMKGKAYRRFRNLKWYMQQRRETEKWLRDTFVQRGGRPTLMYPRYFVLGESEFLRQGYGEHAATIRIPLDEVDTAHVSFTLDDSMKLYLENRQPRIWLKEELEENLLNTKGAYVEAQIWDLGYFER